VSARTAHEPGTGARAMRASGEDGCAVNMLADAAVGTAKARGATGHQDDDDDEEEEDDDDEDGGRW
jgi:hypothetical protein